MATCNNLKQLEAELRKRLNAALQDDVAETVKKTESEHVEENVYGAYGPEEYLVYKRRGESGGLADTGNMVMEAGDLEISIENKTPFNPGYNTMNGGDGLDMLVEYGDGGGGHVYDYPRSSSTPPFGDFHQPRPFVHETVEELKRGKLREAVVAGLAKRGVIAE